jgi:hypothetical protein
MTEVLNYQTYLPSTYDDLPSLHTAESHFKSKDAFSIIANEIKKCFEDSQMEYTFGLALLHRHFHLSPRERLVDSNGTSSPWNIDSHPFASYLQPTSWRLNNAGTLEPYEFELDPEGTSMKWSKSSEGANEVSNFAKKLFSLLEENKVDGIFGLTKYPGNDFKGALEITEGRTSIDVKPEKVSNLKELWDKLSILMTSTVQIHGSRSSKCCVHRLVLLP